MGNCTVEDNPVYKKYSKRLSYFPTNPFEQNDILYSRNNSIMNSNIINNNCNVNNNIINNNDQGVYRIIRKKKVAYKKTDKLKSHNIIPIQDNNTNNSTTSKSKNTTDLSEIYPKI